jgi:hypothetical protein
MMHSSGWADNAKLATRILALWYPTNKGLLRRFLLINLIAKEK